MRAFISHSTKDIYFAEKLKSDLSKQGIDVVSADDLVLPGDIIPDKIIQGITQSDAYIAVLSHNFYEQDRTRTTELIMAVSAELQGRLKLVIPVIIERNIKIPSILADRAYADFSDESQYQKALQILIKTIKSVPVITSERMKGNEKRQWEYVLSSKLALEAEKNELQARRSAQNLRIFSFLSAAIAFLGLIVVGAISALIGSETLRNWLLAFTFLCVALVIISIFWLIKIQKQKRNLTKKQ